MSQAAFDLDLDDGGEPTYTVGELTDAINGALRRQFGDGVWVRGEIQGYNERGQHAYFRLVESDDERKAVLDVSFFANVRMRLRPLLNKHRLHLTDGMKVRVFGVLDVYAPSGRLSLKMAGIDPRYTLGEMAIRRDEIVRRLVANGLYDANRTRALVDLPLRIGLVTSVNSAAWHDFMHELKQSGHGFGVRVVDVRVQGDLAAAMITGGIAELSRRNDVDVIVVIRGGGSRTELAMFDSESIAAAIAASPVPVFTGLGHEIDRSVADEVAHSAFKTPTACAVALIERVGQFATRAESTWSAIATLAAESVRAGNAGLLDKARRIHHRTVAAVERSDQRLADRAHRSALAARRVLDRADVDVRRAAQTLATRPAQAAERVTADLTQLEARIRSLDPALTLARGWSITRTADGRVVRAADELTSGELVTTTLASGSVTSRVESIAPSTDGGTDSSKGSQ